MKQIIFFVTLFFLGGCDMPGYLDMKNCTESNAYYLTYSKSVDGVKDTVILDIPSNDTKGILFGFGQHWTDEGIQDYLSQIEKIEIITNEDTITMTDKKELFQYFRKRRKGLFKQTLKIKIE